MEKDLDLPRVRKRVVGSAESPTKSLLSTVAFAVDPQLMRKLSPGVKEAVDK